MACPSFTAMVFWCGGGLFSAPGKGWQNWQKAIFNIGTGGSTTGKGSQNWQKAIFNRISEGTLDSFLVRFRGVSVLHCHGVLVWRRAVRPSLPWCFGVAEGCFQHRRQYNGKRLAKLAKDYF